MPFLGFVKYKQDGSRLTEFINQNSAVFNNLPGETVDALAEITKSKELLKLKNDFHTPEGGVNMCEGIRQIYNSGFGNGEISGRLKELFELVTDGLLSVQTGALRAKLGEDEFKKKMSEYTSASKVTPQDL